MRFSSVFVSNPNLNIHHRSFVSDPILTQHRHSACDAFGIRVGVRVLCMLVVSLGVPEDSAVLCAIWFIEGVDHLDTDCTQDSGQGWLASMTFQTH